MDFAPFFTTHHFSSQQKTHKTAALVPSLRRHQLTIRQSEAKARGGDGFLRGEPNGAVACVVEPGQCPAGS